MRQMRNRTMKSADLATLRSLHGRKRWEHIWAYYKLPIIGVLIVLYIFGYAAYRHFTKKEAVLYVSLVNISAGSDLTGQLTDGFAQYAHLTKKQQVNLLTGLIINETANADEQYVYASELKLLAAVSAQQLDVILMDTAAREQLQGEEYFLDLRTLDADFSSLDELSADGVTLDISDTPLSTSRLRGIRLPRCHCKCTAPGARSCLYSLSFEVVKLLLFCSIHSARRDTHGYCNDW